MTLGIAVAMMVDSVAAKKVAKRIALTAKPFRVVTRTLDKAARVRGPLMRYSVSVRARGAAIFAAACVASCLFPTLGDLSGASDATAEAGPDAPVPDANNGQDVVTPPLDAGDGGCSVSDPNLVGWWKLDEGSGLTAYDCSGNGRDGTFVYGTPANWVAGRNDAGAAIHVDRAASSGCITVATFPAITGALSIALWTNITDFPPDGGNKQYLAGKAFDFASGGFRLATTSPPDEYDFGIDKLDAGAFETLAAAVSPGTWVHLATVYVPGVDVTFYVNGAVAAHKVNAPGAIADDPKAAFRIGCRADGNDYIDAIIDDVRVYDRALSSGEVATLATP
jgi:hypothetical protein